mgnify:FL=1
MPEHTPSVLPDTNFLLDHPAVHEENWLLPSLEILITETVISELRGLAKSVDPNLARKAQIALQEIEKYQGVPSDPTENQTDVVVKIVERYTNLVAPLDPQIPDHQLIAYAHKQLHSNPPRFCAILSNDKILREIAEVLAVYTVSRQNDNRFHQELLRKYEWWIKVNDAKRLNKTPVKKALIKSVRRKPATKQIRLSRMIKKLYRRIESVGCRTTVFLAPLQARLTLALEIVNRQRNPDRHVVIVVVRNKEMAQFWAGELRQMGKFTTTQVEIFGTDPAERLDQARIVIYRHDQVSRRLPQHVSRLAQAEKKITAVVDGCDLLDPVELALLLYECDQFIGLNHLPIGCRHTPGHRMLNAALHNHSLIDYSFADAERDGWGHPCDLYLNEIQFSLEELQAYDQINTNYVQQRQRAIQKYPELSDTESFWDQLDRLLERAAKPELVDMIKYREQLEEMAQICRGKLEKVNMLLALVTKQPYRRLIFDFTRQWTPVLLNHLNKLAGFAAELPHGEEQRKVWDQFAGNRINTLVLSDVPAIDLPGANFHQLIILTPLRPMAEILDMIDWALSHTQTNDALRLDLLYVSGTPEEIAMIELAEASFNLRYS